MWHWTALIYWLTDVLDTVPSVLWCCWLGGRKGIRPVKIERWGAGVVVCWEWVADLHMTQLMPLPLIVSRLVYTFLIPAHPVRSGQMATKRVRTHVCNVLDRSAEFSDFIAKCLVKDPDHRPSAGDLCQVLLLLPLCFSLYCVHGAFMPSVLWHCWLSGRKGIRPVKAEWWGAGIAICLERCADLHMAQLMPLPLTLFLQ